MFQALLTIAMTIVTFGIFSNVNGQTSDASEILILVKPEHKKELIADGILPASVFSNSGAPEVIVLDLKTDLNITLFQDQGKVDIAAKCFVGTPEAAAEVLKKLVANVNNLKSATTDLVKTIVTKSDVTIVYDQLDVTDVISEKRFEIPQCKSTVSTDAVAVDPIVGKYAMCTSILVQLPDSVATGIASIKDSKLTKEAKLTGLKSVFAALKADRTSSSYCSVVAALGYKGKKEDNKIKCEDALISDDVIISELLDFPLTPARKKESLCAISTIISMMVFGF